MTEYRIIKCGCAPSCYVVARAADNGLLESVANFTSWNGADSYIRSVRDRTIGLGRGRARSKARP